MKQDYYASSVQSQLVDLLSAPPSIIHAPFDHVKDWDAFKGPCLEYTIFAHKKEIPGAKESLVKNTGEILDLARSHEKCYGACVEPSIENPDELVIFLSWPTVEVRLFDVIYELIG